MDFRRAEDELDKFLIGEAIRDHREKRRRGIGKTEPSGQVCTGDIRVERCAEMTSRLRVFAPIPVAPIFNGGDGYAQTERGDEQKTHYQEGQNENRHQMREDFFLHCFYNQFNLIKRDFQSVEAF